MHTRRLITFLLGFWFSVVLTIASVATIAFRVAGNTSKTPPAEPARALNVIGDEMTGLLFRYVAAEINRYLFETSGLVELALVFVIACLLFFQNYSRTATILAGVLLLMTCASQFLLTPQVVSQGRLLDFRPVEMMLPERARFAQIHMFFGIMTVLRLICGAAIATILLKRSGTRYGRRRGDQVDAIDNAEDRHINR